MPEVIYKMSLRHEQDVVRARQRARHMAEVLGFDQQAQIRLGTATSEIARNAFRYAKSGAVEFQIDVLYPQQLVISITDKGPGIANLDEIYAGQYKSRTGLGKGIIGTRRLMDYFEIQTGPRGTTVRIGSQLPKRAAVQELDLKEIARKFNARESDDPFEEVERQNQELLKTLEELRERQEELAKVNSELEDTNRGVVALYAELDERATALGRVSDLKSSFLSNMSHEFRTPLNSILSLARLLLQKADGDLTPEQSKQVGYIQKSALDLSELVNDLLDLAKVEAGKIQIHPRRFVVADLFGALRGVLKPLLLDNSVNLVFEEPGSLPTMRTDEGKVSQILRNFISNALKFTPAGEVRVTAARLNEQSIAFSVTDTGIGIAAADHERIFEEFTQIESSRQRGRKGTGLGLPLSRKLARLLGGDVTVTSELGHGSTFTAIIPAIYPAVAHDEVHVEIPRIAPGQLPVLIVEDNRETAFLMESYLKRSAFGVIRAHSLEETRSVLKRTRPAAVILDVMLEEEPAWDLLQELQNRPDSAIPVLVVSVLDEAKRALALGASGFLKKPVSPDALLHKLGEMTRDVPESRKLLVVDDDEISRYVLRSLLTEAQSSFSVIEAGGGREGLELAGQELPDIIFLDLRMPDLDGFEVLEQLRTDPRTKDIPVVIHSSYTVREAERDKIDYARVSIFPKEWVKQADAVPRLKQVLSSLALLSKPPKTPQTSDV